MNVYDFDGTIYDGESVFDFYLFAVRKNIRLLRYLPMVLRTLIRYKRCKINEEELDQIVRKYATAFIREVPDPVGWVKEFWDKNERKIKDWYQAVQREDDVVISASFDILLDEICNRMGIRHYLSSVIDVTSGEVSVLCFRKNKPKLWAEKFPNVTIDSFYSDSAIDTPMMEIANRAYLVKGESIKQVK